MQFLQNKVICSIDFYTQMTPLFMINNLVIYTISEKIKQPKILLQTDFY